MESSKRSGRLGYVQYLNPAKVNIPVTGPWDTRKYHPISPPSSTKRPSKVGPYSIWPAPPSPEEDTGICQPVWSGTANCRSARSPWPSKGPGLIFAITANGGIFGFFGSAKPWQDLICLGSQPDVLYVRKHPASGQGRIDPDLSSTVLSLLVEITPSASERLGMIGG